MNKLFSIKGFIPFVAIAFLNASLDLAHKITIQNVLLKSYSGEELVSLSALINTMILLPFIFLFSPAGFINDTFNKIKVIRIAALAGIVLSVCITLSYVLGLFWISFGFTLLLAIQSAIYSPAKYALIKNIVGTESIGRANGIIQAISITAILISSLGFSFIFEQTYGGFNSPEQILPNLAFIGLLLIAISSLETWSAFLLPEFEEKKTDKERFSFKRYFLLSYLSENLKIIKSRHNIWLSIIGLSIFWGISQLVLAAFPAHYKAVTGSDNAIAIQAILAVSAIGLIIGSTKAGNMSKHHIELGIVPIGALGLFASLFFFGTLDSAFGMALSSLAFGFFGGFLIVPLNATIQFFSPDKHIGKILSGNNFLQNISMLGFLLLSISFVKFGFSTRELFLIACLVSLGTGLYAILQVPHLFTRLLLNPILKSQYHINIQGIKNLPQSGGALLLGNHISWIDWLVLQIASPRAIKFVMYRGIYDQWYLNWFLKLFNVIPIGTGSSKDSIKGITERLKNGEIVALFPEGHISYNGQLGDFKRGFELALKECDVPVIPFYLRGLWGSSFSRATKHYKDLTNRRGKREIIVAFGKPCRQKPTAVQIKQKILELSFSSWESFINKQEPLMHHWIDMAKANLRKECVVDTLSGSLNNGKFITAVLIFAKLFRNEFGKSENIGVILPSSAVGAIINMALFICGKKPINLNYTLSEQALKSALDKAEIKYVVSSAKFLEKLKEKGFAFDEILKDKLVTAEELKEKISTYLKVTSFLKAFLAPAWFIKLFEFASVSIDDTATILFSSGSEGEPKGVELTHKNLLTNIKQVSELLNFRKDDVVVNSLPIFHSFGLTTTTIMPLCEGVKMISLPDPTDGTLIGKMAAIHGATILFGTSTFFRLYNRNKKLHPLMFENLRIVVAGAEKLRPDVKEGFRLKFGHEIYEGYGTTETAPVVSVNTPNMLEPERLSELTFNKPGSVGMPLPGTVVKIVDPDTLKELPVGEDGLIVIGGGQVMKGYLKDKEKTDEVIATIDGTRYYKTGDKGHIDEDGFIFIVDRYSRFAKIGGEMISLGSVEAQISKILGDDNAFIAVNVPDSKKGEVVVLLIKTELEETEIGKKLRASDMSPLMLPSKIFKLEELPVLASGKADFKKAKVLALELVKA